jgi:ABC-2 type transport system ATP-binding protein
MDTQDIIKTDGITKRFGEITALDGVSIRIQKGEIYGLLGPNGAGKTTFISILSGLLKQDKGTAEIGGYSVTKEPIKVKGLIGVVPQDIALYDSLSAEQNLKFWGRMYGLSGGILKTRISGVLERVGLKDRRKNKLETFSGGMKRRINIAAGILHNPAVLFLDEPTVGIDPQSRRRILDLVKEFKNQGMTVIYTTHYMEEAEELSDRVGIVDRGVIIASGTPEELRRQAGSMETISLSLNTDIDKELESLLHTVEGVSRASAGGDRNAITVTADKADEVLPVLLSKVIQAGYQVKSAEILKPNLEMVFLEMTGRALRD